MENMKKHLFDVKITREKTENTIGRFCLIRTVKDYEPVIVFQIMFEDIKSLYGIKLTSIHLNRKRQVVYSCDLMDNVLKNSGTHVNEFVKKYRFGYEGYYEKA